MKKVLITNLIIIILLMISLMVTAQPNVLPDRNAQYVHKDDFIHPECDKFCSEEWIAKHGIKQCQKHCGNYQNNVPIDTNILILIILSIILGIWKLYQIKSYETKRL